MLNCVCIAIALAGLFAFGCHAAEPASDDAQRLWNEIEKATAELRPPAEWRTQKPSPEAVAAFRPAMQNSARNLARKAKDFLNRFSENENAGDARFTIVYALSHAVAAGDATAEKEARDFVRSTAANKELPEDERARVVILSASIDWMKNAGMELFIEGEGKFHAAMDREMIASLRAAKKEFPNCQFVYNSLLALAERSPTETRKELIGEIMDSDVPSAAVKALAQHVLNGTKPYAIGKPLQIRFTALDGREVDLAELKGRVVLVEFWATDCGPCIGQIPEIKAVYEKLHAKGFEIIGISLDQKEKTLRRFIGEKQLPWPQHFDGKGWGNKYAVQYGIFGIPTTWLVDRAGNLRVTNARGSLERRVEILLNEQGNF
jgi:thiol-disulfide isomerase/thioredoxin